MGGRHDVISGKTGRRYAQYKKIDGRVKAASQMSRSAQTALAEVRVSELRISALNLAKETVFLLLSEKSVDLGQSLARQ